MHPSDSKMPTKKQGLVAIMGDTRGLRPMALSVVLDGRAFLVRNEIWRETTGHENFALG